MRKSLNIILITLVLTSLCGAAFADEAAQAAAPAGVVNINTAEAEQLALLPGVGLKAAQRIIEYREQHGRFEKATDLMQVKGIGDKSFERLSPYVSVEGKTSLTEKVRSPRKPRSKSGQPSTTASN